MVAVVAARLADASSVRTRSRDTSQGRPWPPDHAAQLPVPADRRVRQVARKTIQSNPSTMFETTSLPRAMGHRPSSAPTAPARSARPAPNLVPDESRRRRLDRQAVGTAVRCQRPVLSSPKRSNACICPLTRACSALLLIAALCSAGHCDADVASAAARDAISIDESQISAGSMQPHMPDRARAAAQKQPRLVSYKAASGRASATDKHP